MARKILWETAYTFVPSTRTITIPRHIPRERLLLITNVTTNQVIYNFSDPSLKATSYTAVINADNSELTTVVLNYNTVAMGANDKLQFTVDEYAERFMPEEQLFDAVQKLRTSDPQSLIDTDFEYGTQPTKWEVLSLVNNKPCQYYDIQDPVAQPSGGARTITALTGTGSSRLVTVVTSSAHGLVAGDKFFIQDSNDPYANGWFMVRSVATTTVSNDTFTYYARHTILTNGSILDATKTFIYKAFDYTASPIPVSATAGAAFVASGTTVTATTTNAHGLVVGDLIYVKGTTAATSNPPNGAWEVATTPTTNTFTFSVVDAPSGAITALTTSLTPRAGSQSIHRAFDGGVKFSTGVSAPGSRVVRQTRKYFRYQSGKGIQFSTGSMMKPVFAVDRITSSSNVVTVNTHYEHFLGVGAQILVSGSTDTAYNGTWTVDSVPTPLSFTYTASSVPATTPAPGWPINIAPTNWYGAQVRIGMFDDQNGFFFEYDGQNFNVVRRDATEQISGEVSTTQGSQTITGTNTAFSTQLSPGDDIVIRGTTYNVESIVSDTQMYVFPEYRGASIAGGGVVSKVTEFRVPQASFNLDKVDGTGPSGVTLDLSKMQMFYIDYAWYGAGAIRFGIKNERGEVIYVHRMTHANVKTAAYIRSGNLPARYEASNETPRTTLTATLASGGASMSVASTAAFPSSGTLFVAQAGVSNQAIEYMSYTGKTATTFTGLTRGLTNVVINPNTGATGGGAVATTFTYSATAPIAVRLYSRQVATGTSHWGSSVIMDGRFDEDKSFVFQTGMANSVVVPRGSTTNRYALLSLRLAPSVDNGVVGVLGQRELINRMQLTLKQMDVLAQSTSSVAYSPGIYLIEVILNGKVNTVTNNNWVNVGGSSLSQVCYHAASTIITGGESIFSYFVSTVTGEASVVAQDLSRVRELGTSILGGGTTNVASTDGTNIFPDGPDIVTICVRNLSGTNVTSSSVNGRLSWTEAQA
jgi:hypothetical protein